MQVDVRGRGVAEYGAVRAQLASSAYFLGDPPHPFAQQVAQRGAAPLVGIDRFGEGFGEGDVLSRLRGMDIGIGIGDARTGQFEGCAQLSLGRVDPAGVGCNGGLGREEITPGIIIKKDDFQAVECGGILG